MTVTDLIHKVVGRSDYSSSDKGVISLCYSGDEDKRETERSILQQSGIKLSEVKVLEKEGVVLDVVLDDYFVGLRCSLDHVWVYTDYTRERLLTL